MGSDPQFSKYPNLGLAQRIFSLAISPQDAQQSKTYVQNAIKQHGMAPLYKHLAHPTEGVLNSRGESTSSAAPASQTPATPQRRGSLVSSNLLPAKRSISPSVLPWDEKVYDELKAENDKELEAIQKEEDDAQENAGETEVQAARAKRAEFWARVGDKVSLQMLDNRIYLTKSRTKLLRPSKPCSRRLVLLEPKSISCSP